ncbi:MAG: lipopolysaccharide heptosyltransferase I, partial [Nitrospinae bacterium]|nr:lipopolysaccharide heptosyltransferase I [Nitrospinota bacterium]
MTSVTIPAKGRLLLVKISAMGDVIHTFPFLAALRTARPDLTIDWVVGDAYLELARLSPHAGNLLPFRRAVWSQWWRPSTLTDMNRFRRRLADADYDGVIDLQGLLRSGLIARLA